MIIWTVILPVLRLYYLKGHPTKTGHISTVLYALKARANPNSTKIIK